MRQPHLRLLRAGAQTVLHSSLHPIDPCLLFRLGVDGAESLLWVRQEWTAPLDNGSAVQEFEVESATTGRVNVAHFVVDAAIAPAYHMTLQVEDGVSSPQGVTGFTLLHRGAKRKVAPMHDPPMLICTAARPWGPQSWE